mgnify:FL=1
MYLRHGPVNSTEDPPVVFLKGIFVVSPPWHHPKLGRHSRRLGLDVATTKENPREKLKALRAEFAKKAAESVTGKQA